MPICFALNYSYYELSVQNWCDDTYYIHGFWPQYNNSDYPTFCNTNAYVPVTGQLLFDMNKYWNNECNNNQNLWSHEWEKHGTCMQQQTGITQNDYFEITINLYRQIINTGWKCGATSDCIVACYNLHLESILCNCYINFP